MKPQTIKRIAKILIAVSFIFVASSFIMNIAAIPEPTPEQMDAFLEAQEERAIQIDRILSKGYNHD